MALIGPYPAGLPQNLPTLEISKFELDENDYVQVRTSAKGTFTPQGLKTALLTTTQEIGSTAVALPATVLANRNSLIIHNKSTVDTLYVGNSNVTADTPVSFPDITWGTEIPPNSFLNWDVASAITLYGRAETGKTILVKITEIA